MSFLKPVSQLGSKYFRKVGLPPALGVRTGYADRYECSKKRPIYPDKVRMGFIPDNYFVFFYPKTGVTGPYTFGVGLLNVLFSKEIYVCDNEFYTGISLAILCVVVVKMLGPKVAKYCDDEIDKFEKNWQRQREEEFRTLQDMIDREELEQWRAEGSLMLMQVKKENVILQLEAAYRCALMQAYTDVKNRLDYQVTCRSIEKRFMRKHMATWLMKNITDELAKSMDQKLLTKHIADLRVMVSKVTQ